jgi:hypothetical protein
MRFPALGEKTIMNLQNSGLENVHWIYLAEERALVKR